MPLGATGEAPYSGRTQEQGKGLGQGLYWSLFRKGKVGENKQFRIGQSEQWGVPDSSVGKESACDAGDPGLIPGSGRSAGEGIGYPLQYSWTSLVAHLVKNPPAMRETYV